MGIFLTHRIKAQKVRGKFRSVFREKIRSSKKIFRAKFTLQTRHLNSLSSLFETVLSETVFGPSPRVGNTIFRSAPYTEGVSTGVWCVPGFGAGFEIALKPSNCRKKEKSWKRALLFSAPTSGMHQALVQKRCDLPSITVLARKSCAYCPNNGTTNTTGSNSLPR